MTADRTNAIRGLAILGIVFFHIMIALEVSPLFNFWGGVLVAVFLMLSGYGLHESFQRKGLQGYWSRRWHKVFLPSIIYVCLYNLLCTDGSLRKCVEDLLNERQTYWFLFHILKCYLIYWVAMSLGGRHAMRLLTAGAIGAFAFSQLWYHNNLESGQTLSFAAGVWLSRHKDRWQSQGSGQAWRTVALLLLTGALAYVTKAIPAVHALKPTLAYSPLIFALNFSWGLAALAILLRLRPERMPWLGLTGKYSLYLYVVHIPMMHYIHDLPSTGMFLAWVTVGMLGCVLYRRYIEGRMPVSGMLYVAVSACFVAKYSARLLPSAFPYVTFAFILMALCMLRLIMQSGGRRATRASLALGTLALAGMLLLQYRTDPYSIQVDRWSALAFPIRNLLHGICPYAAHTHLGGSASPFPVWQVLHIPFYLLGNVGLSLFAALGAYLWGAYRTGKAHALAIASWLLACCVPLWYEAMVRSDLMTNMLLTALLALWLLRHLSPEWLARHWLPVAVYVALAASTRLITLVPLGLLLLPCCMRLRHGILLVMALTALAVFTATLAPLAYWGGGQLSHNPFNPWALQTRQGYPADFILFVPLTLALAFGWRGCPSRYFRNAGVMLFLFVSITFVHRMYDSDNWDLFSSAYDITYLSAALPFAILSLALQGGEEVPGSITRK